MGDGNLHLNISTPALDSRVFNLIEPHLLQQTALHGGSVSAEHGLGQAKSNYIYYSKSAPMVDLMRCIKELMDPVGILNPYKLFPTNPAPPPIASPINSPSLT